MAKRTYSRSFRCSEHFPVEFGEEWNVREGNKVVEHWRVTRCGKTTFEVEIQEFMTALANNSPSYPDILDAVASQMGAK